MCIRDSPHCDLDLQDSNQSPCMKTMAHDNTSQGLIPDGLVVPKLLNPPHPPTHPSPKKEGKTNMVTAIHTLPQLCYRVVPKRLLTFLGTVYKGCARTTPGTLVYRFERQTARKNISSLQKHCVLDIECRILSQEPSDSFILDFMDFNVIFHGK